jgi:hypothetical protein
MSVRSSRVNQVKGECFIDVNGYVEQDGRRSPGALDVRP